MTWLLCFLLVGPVWADEWRVGVKVVFDGDTVLLTTGERLRIRGIDAPEVRHGQQPGQFYGSESKALLQQLVRGQQLVLKRKELTQDRYGRIIGTPFLSDGRNLSLLLVEQGAAFVYPHGGAEDRAIAQALLTAQRTAIKQGQGFWPTILALPVAEHTYLGTISSQRFHRTTCSLGRKVKKRNQVRFDSLATAFEAGYAPARCCTPWPRQARK